jgi:hypothetical protein
VKYFKSAVALVLIKFNLMDEWMEVKTVLRDCLVSKFIRKQVNLFLKAFKFMINMPKIDSGMSGFFQKN